MVKKGSGPVAPFFMPPTLPARQFFSAFLMALLTGWKFFPSWMARHGTRCVPGASGALGMGCIGFPNHPVWEVTSRCNLDCIHCHARGSRQNGPELSTSEGLALLDELAKIPGFRMVAFTGGEPLVRDDLFSLLAHAKSLGFSGTIATNATLVDFPTARKLRDNGIAIAAVSLDGCDPAAHDSVRGVRGSFDAAIEGIHAINRAGIPLHINITVMNRNRERLGEIMELANQLKAAIIIIYQMVPVGRGRKMGEPTPGTAGHADLVRFIAGAQSGSRAIIEPVAAPQYWAHLLERNTILPTVALRLAGHLFFGCCAGRGFIYVKPDGEVWPCPFLEVSCGNTRDTPFSEIWKSSPVLARLRERALRGKCGSCRYQAVCGGCRGRAYVMTGDFMQEDPFCFIKAERDDR
ncbi:MAG TPA: radical SAM protein [Methanolinea sp.]|nr:radical SAM protein [Methanolinea sp.]HQJ18426.1 radical SAM protein [Methanolinea sp.]